MKLIQLIIVIGLIAGCNIRTNTTVRIYGEVKSSEGNSLVLFCHELPDTIVLDENGSFDKEIDLDGPTDGYIRVGTSYFYVYLEPGKELGISFDLSEVDETIKFMEKLGPQCEYLYKKRQRSYNHSKHLFEMYRPPNFEGLVKVLDSIRKDELMFLDQYAADKPAISEKFVRFEKETIKFSMLSELYRFPYSVNPKYRDTLTVPSDWFNFKEAIDYSDPNLMNNNKALWFCIYDVSYSTIDRLGINIDNIRRNPAFVREVFNQVEQKFTDPKFYDVLGHYFLSYYVENDHSGYSEIKDLLDAYILDCSNNRFRQQVISIRNKWAPVLAGNQSFNFEILDETGHLISLKDFRGKYVYLDFWTTWCGPCKSDIPYLMGLIHRYADKPIVFISISCDKDKSAWIKMLQDGYTLGDQKIEFVSAPNWIHLHSPTEAGLQKNYLVPGYPTYILIDPDGNYVSVPAPEPQEQQLIDLLDEKLGNINRVYDTLHNKT